MLLALFQPDIPQNTGSLIRLAACLGVGLHIIEPCGYPFNDKRMRRAVMDYYDHADIVRHVSWEKFLEWRAGKGRLVLLTTHAKTTHLEFTFAPDDILLLGRESAGVPDGVKDAADAQVKIPLKAGVRSLNVSQAASMMLAEGLRQTTQFPG